MAFWSGIMRIALRILNSKLPNYQLVTCQPGESPQLTSFSPKKNKGLEARSSTPCSIRLCFSSKTFLAEFRDLSALGPWGRDSWFQPLTVSKPKFRRRFPNGKEHRNNTNPTTTNTNIVWFFEDCIFFWRNICIFCHICITEVCTHSERSMPKGFLLKHPRALEADLSTPPRWAALETTASVALSCRKSS